MPAIHPLGEEIRPHPVPPMRPAPEPVNHLPTDYFWTDFEQAYQRLYGTVVTFEDRPVYMVQVTRPDRANGPPRGYFLECGKVFQNKNPTMKVLNDPGFHRFRELPKLGWVNFIGNRDDQPPTALFLSRRPIQGTQHGLSARNVMVQDAHGKGSGWDFTTVIADDGFLQTQAEDYPPVAFLLEALPRGHSAGVSLDYAIATDATLGIKYLIRRTEKVGLFAGEEIRLPEHMLFLRDEIQATPCFQGRVVVQL